MLVPVLVYVVGAYFIEDHYVAPMGQKPKVDAPPDHEEVRMHLEEATNLVQNNAQHFLRLMEATSDGILRDKYRKWAQMALEEGMIGLITADSGAGPKAVAPFGGRARRLGTNPICIGMPSDLEGPVLLDMATSAVAQGKISLARSRGEAVPPGWIINKDGNPTTDPNEYFGGGAILPVGADQGHKGYGLSFMVEVFSGLLTGLGFGIDPQAKHNDGCFISVFNVEHFRSLTQFKTEVAEFVQFVKTSPPAAGFSEVLYPGEIEHLTEQRRRKEGIYVEDETWEQIAGLMKELDVEKVVGRP